MEKYLKIFIVVLLSNVCLIGQGIIPPAINDILEIEPLWSYQPFDSDFYVIDTFNNHNDGYGMFVLSDYKIKENTLYVVESFFGHAFVPFGHGYTLYAINLETGEEKWKRSMSYFSGEEKIKSSIRGELSFEGEDKIIMNGWIGIDSFSYFENCPSCPVYVNPMQQVIDINSGELIEEITNAADTARNVFKSLGNIRIGHIGEDRELMKHYIFNGLENGELKNWLQIYTLDQDYNESLVYEYEHNTHITNGLLTFSYLNQYLQLNDKIGVALFGSIDPMLGSDPTELKLIYFDTKDLNNIHITKEIDLLEKIIPNQTVYQTLFMYNINGHILISQQVNELISTNPTNIDKYRWLAWFDDNGDEVITIDKLENSEGMYYTNRTSSFRIGDELYLIYSPKENSSQQHDFFKITKDGISNIIQSYYKPTNSLTSRIPGINILEFDDNGDVIVRLVFNHDEDENYYRKGFYFAKYSASDFGNILSILTGELSIFSIYPNPVQNLLNIVLPSQEEFKLSCYNMDGTLIFTELISPNKMSLNVDNVPSGNYILRMESNKSKTNYISKMIKM